MKVLSLQLDKRGVPVIVAGARLRYAPPDARHETGVVLFGAAKPGGMKIRRRATHLLRVCSELRKNLEGAVDPGSYAYILSTGIVFQKRRGVLEPMLADESRDEVGFPVLLRINTHNPKSLRGIGGWKLVSPAPTYRDIARARFEFRKHGRERTVAHEGMIAIRPGAEIRVRFQGGTECVVRFPEAKNQTDWKSILQIV